MTTNPDTHPRELCGYEHGCSGCVEPKRSCEVCRRSIRRDHSFVQLSAERSRHHVCHEREANRQ